MIKLILQLDFSHTSFKKYLKSAKNVYTVDELDLKVVSLGSGLHGKVVVRKLFLKKVNREEIAEVCLITPELEWKST